MLHVCVITVNPGNTCLYCAGWFLLSCEISPYHGLAYTIGRFAQGIFLMFNNVAFAWCRWMKICLHTGRCIAGIILGMVSANERRCYNVTSSLIGWVHTQNDPCNIVSHWLSPYPRGRAHVHRTGIVLIWIDDLVASHAVLPVTASLFYIINHSRDIACIFYLYGTKQYQCMLHRNRKHMTNRWLKAKDK